MKQCLVAILLTHQTIAFQKTSSEVKKHESVNEQQVLLRAAQAYNQQQNQKDDSLSDAATRAQDASSVAVKFAENANNLKEKAKNYVKKSEKKYEASKEIEKVSVEYRDKASELLGKTKDLLNKIVLKTEEMTDKKVAKAIEPV